MLEQPPTTTPAGRRSPTVQWVIAVLLAFIAGVLWSRSPGELVSAARAQTPPLVGARGVYAFTGQLDHSRYGLFMLDIEQGTIWCYGIDTGGGVSKLRLIAARSWIYDRYLRDFNCADPTYKQVQELVAQQRAISPSATPDSVDGDSVNPPPPTQENSSDRR